MGEVGGFSAIKQPTERTRHPVSDPAITAFFPASFPASFWLHLARQSLGHVQEALALKGLTAWEGQKPHEPGRKIQGLDTLLLRTVPAQSLAATGLTCVS